MQITYRRKGGLLTLIVLGAFALAATVLLVTAAAAVAIVLAAAAAVAVLIRAVGGRLWRRTATEVPTAFRAGTIEGTVVSSEPSERR